MNTIVYYLQEVLEQLIEKVPITTDEYKVEFDKGKLWGYYFSLSKVLSIAEIFGFTNYLPENLKDFDPETLIKGLRNGVVFRKEKRNAIGTSTAIRHKDSYLREVLEQLIGDAIDLREGVRVKNDFDDGIFFAYYCTILTLLNQAEGFGLSGDLPEFLRDFIPEHLSSVRKSDLGI